MRGQRPGGRRRLRLGEQIADMLLDELEQNQTLSVYRLIFAVEDAASRSSIDKGIICRAALRRLARYGVHLERERTR